MNNFKFKTNINCESCVKTVTPFLNELDNIDLWKVDLTSDNKILDVELEDLDKLSVIKAIEKSGYKIEEI